MPRTRRCCSPAARIRWYCCAWPKRPFGPGRFPFPLLHIDTGHNFPEVIAFRDYRAKRTRRAPDRALGRGFDRQRSRRAAPAGRKPQSPSVGHLARRDRRVRVRRAASAARAATRKRRAPRSASSRSATSSANGTRATSARSSGTCTTPACTRASTCASFRSPTGPSSTCGSTSRASSSKCRRSISRTSAPVVRRGGLLVPVTDSRRRATAKRSSRRLGALPHRRRHHLHLPGRIGGGDGRRDHRRDGGRDDHRARRHAPGRPDHRRLDGTAQEGRIFLMSATENLDVLDHGVLRFLTAGSVDDGKSTLIGRLLYDTQAILADQLAAVERTSRAPRSGARPVAADRRAHGRTRAGHHDRRRLPLLRDRAAQVHHRRRAGPRAVHAQHGDGGEHRASRDPAGRCAPWHRRRRRAATRRSRTCSASSIWSSRSTRWTWSAYARRVRAHRAPISAPSPQRIGIDGVRFVPMSALDGDMVVERGANLDWYDGPDAAADPRDGRRRAALADAPLRFPVQFVSRPRRRRAARLHGPRRVRRRSPSATRSSCCPPAARRGCARSATHDGRSASAGLHAGDHARCSNDELDIARGDMLVREHATRRRRPPRSMRDICWLRRPPLDPRRTYLLRHTTREVRARIDRIDHRWNVSTQQRGACAGNAGHERHRQRCARRSRNPCSPTATPTTARPAASS